MDSLLLTLLFPHLTGLEVGDVERDGEQVSITASTRTSTATCPTCSIGSTHLHSRYRRTLTDLGPARSAMRIHLTVKRFRCRTKHCERTTFAEQVEGLTARYRRTTPAAQEVIARIGVALIGRAGARLARVLGIARSRHTFLRAVRALPDPEPPEAIPVIGIDDFAFRKRHTYGTVIVDQTTGRVLDVLPDRQAETVAAWLSGREGIEVVCRDRAASYGAAITAAQPEAVQVADRWHLWKNLCDAVDRAIAANRRWASLTDDPEPVPRRAEDAAPEVDRVAEGRRAQNTRRRWAQVHQLLGRGLSDRAMARRLGCDPGTVRRYAAAASPEELLNAGTRTLSLDRFEHYLRERWGEGCRDGSVLFAELKAMGWKGTDRTLRRYLEPWRTELPASRRRSALTTMDLAKLLTCPPERLDHDDALRRKQLLATHSDLAALADLVSDFAQILTGLEGHRLTDWIDRALTCGIPALIRFAEGLRRDLRAVTAGLTLPYNSGRVEGHMNRIKLLKRQAFGRAHFDLLRKRILLA